MKKILITGAGGVLGKSIPEMENYDIIRTDKKTLDITKFKEVKEFIEKNKPEVIIHLASIVGGKCDLDKELTYKVNVEATVNLAKIAKDNGLKRFIFTSTCAIYDQKNMYPTAENENINPRSNYAETKLLAEKELLKICDPLIFRIFNIYGGKFKHSLINKLRGEELTMLFDPDTYYRDYIHYTDVVNYLLKGIDIDMREGQVLNLGSGIIRSTSEVLTYLQKRKIYPNYEVAIYEDTSISWANINKLSELFKSSPSGKLILNNLNNKRKVSK